MGTKYKKERHIEQDNFKQVIGSNLYKRRSIFFFLFFLCISLFLFSGLFLNKQNSENKAISTEGIVIEKIPIDKHKADTIIYEDMGCEIKIEFNLRNGKKIQKTISIEKEFCPYINSGDILSVLYHYNPWRGNVTIVSYSRLPIQKDDKQKEISDGQAL